MSPVRPSLSVSLSSFCVCADPASRLSFRASLLAHLRTFKGRSAFESARGEARRERRRWVSDADRWCVCVCVIVCTLCSSQVLRTRLALCLASVLVYAVAADEWPSCVAGRGGAGRPRGRGQCAAAVRRAERVRGGGVGGADAADGRRAPPRAVGAEQAAALRAGAAAVHPAAGQGPPRAAEGRARLPRVVVEERPRGLRSGGHAPRRRRRGLRGVDRARPRRGGAALRARAHTPSGERVQRRAGHGAQGGRRGGLRRGRGGSRLRLCAAVDSGADGHGATHHRARGRAPARLQSEYVRSAARKTPRVPRLTVAAPRAPLCFAACAPPLRCAFGCAEAAVEQRQWERSRLLCQLFVSLGEAFFRSVARVRAAQQHTPRSRLPASWLHGR